MDERGAASAIPVARSFVAAAIRRIWIEKPIQTAHDLVHGARTPLRVALEDQHARQPVRVDPRIPVVHDLPRAKAHPPEVVALERRREHSATDLVTNAFAQPPRDRGGWR